MTLNALLTLGLTNAVLATLLAICGWCLTRVWKNPHVASIVWLVVLLKLVTPSVIPLPIAVNEELAWNRSPVTSGETASEVITRNDMADARRAAGVSLPSPSPVSPPPIALDANEEPLATASSDVTSEPFALNTSEDVQTAFEVPFASPALKYGVEPKSPSQAIAVSSVLLVVWALGVVAMLVLTIVRVVRFRRCLKAATVSHEDVQHEAQPVARRLNLTRCPKVRFVEASVGPLVWAGGVTPIVVVPRPLWMTLDPSGRETLLAHEFAHIARRDHWVRRFEAVVLALFWWLPTTWYAVRRREAAAESCCDAIVLSAYPNQPQAYAEALFHAVSLFSTGRPLPLASGLGRITELKERLAMIAHDKVPTKPSRIVRLGLLLAAMAALLVSAVRANPEDNPKPDAKESSAGDGGETERQLGQEVEDTRWLPVEDLIADAGTASIAVAMDTPKTTGSEAISYILIRGIWPVAAQQREWERMTGARTTVDEVLSAVVDFEIERQPAAPLGGKEQSWDRLDLESTNRVLERASAFAVETSDPKWQSPVITAPLPKRTAGEWKNASHPRLDEAKAGDVILFRYPDFEVPPGGSYRYRVRLKLMNEIHGAEAEVWTEWSEPTEWVTVPYVNDAKEGPSDPTLIVIEEGPFRGAMPPGGRRGAAGRSARGGRSPQMRPSDEAVAKMLAGLAKVIESPKEPAEVKVQALRSYGRLARGTGHAKEAEEVLFNAAKNAKDDRTILGIADALHALGSPKGVELMWTVFGQKPDMEGQNLETRQTAYRMLDNADAVPPTVESVRLVAEFLTTSGGGFGEYGMGGMSPMMGGMPGAFGPSGWLSPGPLSRLTRSPDGIRRLVEATASLPKEDGAMIGLDEAGSMEMGGGMASALSPRDVLLNVLKATAPANEEIATALVEALMSKDAGVRAAAAEALGNVSELPVEDKAASDPFPL